MNDNDKDLRARRSVITGFGAAATGLALVSHAASGQSSGSTDFKPARHQADAWMDEQPGQHRVFIDSATARGGAAAVLYANNLYRAQQRAYAGEAADFAIIVCFRHYSTPFGYTDAIWAKYGEIFAAVMDLPDPATGEAPTTNMLRQDRRDLPNAGVTIDALAESHGTQFAICEAATGFLAGRIAETTGGTRADVFAELVDNAIPNSRFVSAGVMALTRAQEYGYSLLYAG